MVQTRKKSKRRTPATATAKAKSLPNSNARPSSSISKEGPSKNGAVPGKKVPSAASKSTTTTTMEDKEENSDPAPRKCSGETSPVTAVSPVSTSPAIDNYENDNGVAQGITDCANAVSKGAGASSKDLEMLKQKHGGAAEDGDNEQEKQNLSSPPELQSFAEKWSEISHRHRHRNSDPSNNTKEANTNKLDECGQLGRVRRAFRNAINRKAAKVTQDRIKEKSKLPVGFEPSTAQGCKNGEYEVVKLSLPSMAEQAATGTMFHPSIYNNYEPSAAGPELQMQPSILSPSSILPYDTLGNPFQPSPLDFAALTQRKFSNSAAAATRSYLLGAISEEMNRSSGFSPTSYNEVSAPMGGALEGSVGLWPGANTGFPDVDYLAMGGQTNTASGNNANLKRSSQSQGRDCSSLDEYDSASDSRSRKYRGSQDRSGDRRDERRRRKSKRRRSRRRRERRSRSRRKYKRDLSSSSSYSDSDSSRNYKRRSRRRRYRSSDNDEEEDVKMAASGSSASGASAESSIREEPRRSSRRRGKVAESGPAQKEYEFGK